MSNIALRSAHDQAVAIRTGEISSSELLEITLERFERLNPAINAVVATQLDVARERAAEADAATAGGESWGPLHGVPMTIKEAWDWVGSASTSGYPDRLDWRPECNSEAVQRLLDAGAVIYGKTNLPVGMADWQTFNPVYGTTGNPWNPDLVPGGSSGGAAAALAAGLTALELGSDIGASIRNPAHYCGVFGHKPTYGLVPDAGHGNPGSPVSLDIGVGGPMARYASDLALGLDIVAGASGMDARGWRLDLPAPRRTRPDEWRVAVMLDHEVCEVDRELVDQLAATVDAVSELGVRIDRTARPDIDIARMHDVYIALLRAATGTEYADEQYAALADDAQRFDDGDRDYRARSGASGTDEPPGMGRLPHRTRTRPAGLGCVLRRLRRCCCVRQHRRPRIPTTRRANGPTARSRSTAGSSPPPTSCSGPDCRAASISPAPLRRRA